MTWTTHYPEHAPKPHFHQGNNSLGITLDSEKAVGYLEKVFTVIPGKSYRIACDAIVPECSCNNATIIVTWSTTDSDATMVQRDYVFFKDLSPTQRHFEQVFQAPEKCTHAIIWCMHKWQRGTATFNNLEIAETNPVSPKIARLAAVNLYYPPANSTFESNRADMEAGIKNLCQNVPNLDFILLPETHPSRGVPGTSFQRSEPIQDGPTFNLCKHYAVKYNTNICASVIEREQDNTLHCTAFVVDRTGNLAGIFRKVHLTVGEQTSGIIPGKEFNIIKLDFASVGISICWDNWFLESARMQRLNGADFLAFPLAGDAKESHWSKTWSARCIDNSLPMVVSVADPKVPSAIIDRDGVWLDQTTQKHGFAFAELDLNERKRSWWLSVGPAFGDPYQLYLAERRQIAYKF